jgi:hypothetical protein
MHFQLNYMIAQRRSAELHRAGEHARSASEVSAAGAQLARPESDHPPERAARPSDRVLCAGTPVRPPGPSSTPQRGSQGSAQPSRTRSFPVRKLLSRIRPTNPTVVLEPRAASDPRYKANQEDGSAAPTARSGVARVLQDGERAAGETQFKLHGRHIAKLDRFVGQAHRAAVRAEREFEGVSIELSDHGVVTVDAIGMTSMVL